MHIAINSSDLVAGIGSGVSNTFGDFSAVIALVFGLAIAFFIVDIIIGTLSSQEKFTLVQLEKE